MFRRQECDFNPNNLIPLKKRTLQALIKAGTMDPVELAEVQTLIEGGLIIAEVDGLCKRGNDSNNNLMHFG